MQSSAAGSGSVGKIRTMFNIFLVHEQKLSLTCTSLEFGFANERNHSPFDQSSQPLSKDGNRVD